MRIQGHDSPVGERDKVSGPSSTGPVAPVSQAASVEGVSSAQAVEAAVVSVSSAASEAQIHAARGQAAHLERLAKVRAAVEDGSYQPDLDRLANRFVEEEMTGPKR